MSGMKTLTELLWYQYTSVKQCCDHPPCNFLTETTQHNQENHTYERDFYLWKHTKNIFQTYDYKTSIFDNCMYTTENRNRKSIERCSQIESACLPWAWHYPYRVEPLAAQQWGYTDYLQIISGHNYQKFNMDNKLKIWKLKGSHDTNTIFMNFIKQVQIHKIVTRLFKLQLYRYWQCH